MKSHLTIAALSIRCFTDDGTLDLKELDQLLGIALLDKVIDDDERRVLRNIYFNISEGYVDKETWVKMKRIRRKYEI